MRLFPPPATQHIARLLHSSLPEQVSKASSLNSVSTSLIPTTIRGVSPERMTLAKGSGGPDTGERESRPQDEGKESLVQEPWCADRLESSGPREQEEQGFQTCVSPGKWNGLITNLTPFQEKVDSVKSRKSCITMKISHCIRLTPLRAIYRMS